VIIDSFANALTAPEPGFGWRSQTVSRIGASWQASPALTLRTGVSHGQQIVSRENATLDYLAPVTPQDHFTLGATYALSRETELSFMYARAFGAEVRGTGPEHRGERGHVPALAGRHPWPTSGDHCRAGNAGLRGPGCAAPQPGSESGWKRSFHGQHRPLS
jgi:hypothetical protein